MKRPTFILLLTICVLGFLSCTQKQPSVWEQSSMWYAMEDTTAQWPADLFYIVSTNVMESHDSLGHVCYNATLTDTERLSMGVEMEYVRQHLSDSLNFVSPYYHQFTMNAILLSPDSFAMAYAVAKADMEEAFRSYLQRNTTRPFVLVGFSQGAMLVLDLLKSMPEDAYSRCRGAYMLGYRITAHDLQHPRIRPAVSATEGLVISFNSVTRPEAQWQLVSAGAAASVNPVSWDTTSAPQWLCYQGDSLRVTLDASSHLLLVDVPDEERYYQPWAEPWYSRGCLHLGDLLFYLESVRRNILLRTNR